jgi:ribosomal protein S18 acetylase RimI-like enzyme
MSEMIIINVINPLIQQLDYKSSLKQIFFETSTRKIFNNQAERDDFEWKYLGFYLAHYPQFAWVAIDNGIVLGYVLGMPYSKDPSLYQIQPHMKKFESLFDIFPGHLHINCHINARGKGIGKRLVLNLLHQMKVFDVKGLHIMTGVHADNRFFYHKLGFDFEHSEDSILFMGIDLRDN